MFVTVVLLINDVEAIERCLTAGQEVDLEKETGVFSPVSPHPGEEKKNPPSGIFLS